MYREYLKHNYKTAILFIIFIIFISCPVTEEEETEESKYIADFMITFTDRMNGQLFPEEATGESATLTMVTGSSDEVDYNRYRIDFAGDTASLPDTVSVTITWTSQEATVFRWGGTGSGENGSITINVPRSGGTVGISGSVCDSAGSFRPGLKSAAGTAGIVKFKATLVHTLTCTILR